MTILFLTAALLAASAQGTKETPVTVEDGGSILIRIPEDSEKRLPQFEGADKAALKHPDKGEMGCVVVTQGSRVIRREKCKKGRPCVVNFLSAGDPTFGDVHLSVTARNGDLAIRSNVPFDNQRWTKTATSFKLEIPGRLTAVDLRDDDGAAMKNICRGGGCSVRISFPSVFDPGKPCQ